MSGASLQVATSPTGFLERPANASEGAPTKKTVARATRRSVSSMKGLLPLTLSSSSSCSSLVSQLPEDALEQRVDDYLPEVLARDLELSKLAFESRSMTAGPPISPPPSPFDDYMDKPRATMSSHRTSYLSPYQSAYMRVQTLGAIQERNSMVSFLDQQEDAGSGDAASDSCSATETDASSIYDAAPPSFLIRHQSIDTNITSLESTKGRPCSSKKSPISLSGSSRCESSWIETDSDVEDEQEDIGTYSTALHLSPRPPTPPEFEAGIDTRYSSGNVHKFLHRKSHSVTGTAVLTSLPGQHLSNSTPQAWRPNPTQYPRHSQIQYPDSPESMYLPILQCTSPPPPHLQGLHHSSESGLYRRLSNRSIQRPGNGHAAEAASGNDGCARLEYNQFVSSIDSKNAPRLDSVYIRPSPPPSPLPSVQMWLDGSAQLFSLPFHSDELARVVPLPPDVMETLRVTTTCFPETMLLNSSLTIETIRAYSRKARNPGSDVTPLPSPQCSTPLSKQSLWRRVVKRGSQSGHRTRDLHTPTASMLQSPSSSSLESPKPWTSIKNVFGTSSDYICDAIYSHIVAYNYISALVARYPTTLGHGRACSPVGSQHEDIPKKAASLLGLHDGANLTSASSIRSSKRFSSSHWGKEDYMTTSSLATSANQDTALRNIQTELLRCIRRLIATARLMAESETTEEKMVEMEMEDADVLLMRSLCEIVRINEETIYL
ncbi:hypothetical protein TARUN_7514 [Trichoderma arundinaceum]|uniref:Uncharacterized protein n=1 Tax=Trichoderma arundinaceum TaxID=490622 RepID=A0A395NFJ8_TRIAR|nr:hypothetical protein TARUN_7514 [Trichoderma arundinaceum]